MILWHLGGTIALVRYVFRDPNMDMRLLMVGALLPDLVDKPLGRVFHSGGYENGHLWGHTLLFSAVLMIVILGATRRRSAMRRMWFPLAVGSLFHLVLDGMWFSAETFLWPFQGTEFTEGEPGNLGDALVNSITNPWVVAGEIVGLLYLIWLWRRARLGEGEYRSLFIHTGRLVVPIGG